MHPAECSGPGYDLFSFCFKLKQKCKWDCGIFVMNIGWINRLKASRIDARTIIPQLQARLSSLRYSDFQRVSMLLTRSQEYPTNHQTNNTFKNVVPHHFIQTKLFTESEHLHSRVYSMFCDNESDTSLQKRYNDWFLKAFIWHQPHYPINTKQSG